MPQNWKIAIGSETPDGAFSTRSAAKVFHEGARLRVEYLQEGGEVVLTASPRELTMTRSDLGLSVRFCRDGESRVLFGAGGQVPVRLGKYSFAVFENRFEIMLGYEMFSGDDPRRFSLNITVFKEEG